MAERRLFQEIAQRIADLVDRGEFPPGSRLPGERELAERFGVSRVTIREAEIALQATGLVRIKTGSGVYVTDAAMTRTSEFPPITAFELTEARSLFEAEAAALAAPIITDEQIARLERLLAEMSEDDDEDSDRATDADRDFHLTIASASDNQAIIHVISSLWRMRTEIAEVRTTYATVCHHDGPTRHQEHVAIVEALRARDPQAARVAMRQHFGRLLEAMIDATEQRELQELRRKSEASRARFLMSAQLS
ncbi:FadR/GntR family transcriptional regulator [Sphingomonas sp. DT-204]|uniref:FadR/GntR family transcriptional regulator n=1 Tax=Sphingomonas sp. DT-204 TaxID=3396166 RepID=UPI003F1B2862